MYAFEVTKNKTCVYKKKSAKFEVVALLHWNFVFVR